MKNGNEMSPSEQIKRFRKDLVSLGITGFQQSNSKTSFGESSYLYVGGFKVRASDHSVTNPGRILDECHISHPLGYSKALKSIEYHYYPERFEEKKELVFGSAYLFPADKLEGVKCEYQILDHEAKITKKGRVMMLIRMKNVENKTLVRK